MPLRGRSPGTAAAVARGIPIDTLKIDRGFICELPKDYAGRMLVKTTISPARAFRLTSVAEGVETKERLDLLWQAGCDQAQGFLHNQPLPREEFMALLQHGRGQFVLRSELARDSEEHTRERNVAIERHGG